MQFVPDQPSLVAAPKRVRRVLGDEQAVFVGNFINPVKVADLTAVVHRDNPLRFWRDFLFNFIGINAGGFKIHVCKDGCCSRVNNGACGGSERHRRGNYLVSGADALCQQRHVERRRAGVHERRRRPFQY